MDLSKTPHLPEDRKQAFETLYHHRLFGEYETVSGKGSTLMATRAIRRTLQRLLDMGMFRTILDIGCGDFHWLSHMDLSMAEYTGTDIVEPLLESNEKFTRPHIRFQYEDIVHTTPTAYDLVLARDLFTHFSAHDVVEAFNHIKRSGSRFLATSSYTPHGVKPTQQPYFAQYTNTDILPGEWRPIDFERAPYNFRPPLFSIADSDPGKYLCFWELDDLPYLGAHTLLPPADNNPHTPEDFRQYRFFRELLALPYIDRITLFGSRAALTSRPDSDIDLMLHCAPGMTTPQWLAVIDIIDNADIPLHIDCYHYHPTVDASLQNTWQNHTTVLYQR